ncbi:tubulin delta chain-like [Watersipora subatra]|uniref:tubulin delta chain-like n=1 Tax=Watersipora subatra TaxID=2589382 RepID=UPI00355B791C
MPFVTVQLGQCGNQLGTQFFKSLIDDALDETTGCSKQANEDYQQVLLDRFFTDNAGKSGTHIYTPRSVLIDMESKVLAQSVAIAQQTKCWRYSAKQQFSQKSGSGNNWAYGYCVHGSRCDPGIEQVIRLQVEKCDRFDGFLCLMSLAGGTGSGLGTYVTEMLRDVYPRAFLVNQVVAPYKSGEVILQSYNALLTLAHLYESSDGLIIEENDHMQSICSRLLGLKNVSFQHINNVIAHKMLHLLAPATQSSTVANHLGHYIEQVYAHPSYKLSSLLTLPLMPESSLQYSTFQWDASIRTMRQMLIAKAYMEEGINWGVKVRPTSNYNKCISNIVVARGKDSSSLDMKSLSEPALYPRWMPAEERLHAYTSERAISGYEKSLSMLCNSQSSIDMIDGLIDKAWSMFVSRAYTHQYSRHGLNIDDFLDCFRIMERVIFDYRNL